MLISLYSAEKCIQLVEPYELFEMPENGILEKELTNIFVMGVVLNYKTLHHSNHISNDSSNYKSSLYKPLRTKRQQISPV